MQWEKGVPEKSAETAIRLLEMLPTIHGLLQVVGISHAQSRNFL